MFHVVATETERCIENITETPPRETSLSASFLMSNFSVTEMEDNNSGELLRGSYSSVQIFDHINFIHIYIYFFFLATYLFQNLFILYFLNGLLNYLVILILYCFNRDGLFNYLAIFINVIA